MFVDRVEIGVEAGRGGDGCVSFRREKYVPRGGPDGGDGGDGGSIIIQAEPGVDSLASLTQKHIWKAKRGSHGQGSNRHGKSGEDIILRVPPGTMVLDAQHGNLLKDMSTPGEEVVIAQGGGGGKGNARFKSATNQAPRAATPGEAGEVRQIRLELKVIADVGLLGKPNAGKSTLLSRLSRARPEIADYPFTTKHPNLGMVQVDMDRSFVMADIPGLIEGAHSGIGLGHEFLKHVERTRVLVHLVEPMPTDGGDPLDNYTAIREEVRLHDPALSQRPEIIAVSKGELPDAKAVQSLLAEETGREVLVISAVTGEGLQRLIQRVIARLDDVD
ncbi:MAG: GTPase ObgE [Pirellulales bacterium]|nr:GTPase ObgE [Pirellulales bacterium]